MTDLIILEEEDNRANRGHTKRQDDLSVTCLLGSIKMWTELNGATNTRRLFSISEELLIPRVVHGRGHSVGQCFVLQRSRSLAQSITSKY